MASLLPSIRYRVVTDAGAPIPGAKVYTYAAGTSTPKASYTSSTAGVANTNPVIADARGEVLMWLSGAYKIVIRDADDNLIDEEDNVVDLTSGGTFATPTFTGTVTYSGTTMTWSGNPTHSGNHIFSGNVTINGNTAIGNASTDTITIAPNAVTWTNGATHSGAHTWSGAQICSSTLAVIGATTLTGALTANGSVTLGDAAADTITFTGTPAGLVVSGTYTPTYTAGTNIASVVSDGAISYLRVGSVVTVMGQATIDPTAGTASSSIGISLPIASNFSNTTQCPGAIVELTNTSTPSIGWIQSDSTNDRASASWYQLTNTTSSFRFWFQYQVL